MPEPCGEPRRVGLRALDEETRRQLEEFVRENKRKLTYEQMREEIRRRWCLDLSVGQIARLGRPRTRRYAVPEDVARLLEEEFGSVPRGIAEIARIVRKGLVDLPPEVKRVARELGGREYEWGELEEKLAEMGFEDIDGIVRLLFKYKVLKRAPSGKWLVQRVVVPPEFYLLRFLAGLG